MIINEENDMNKWFEATAKYEKTTEEGVQKKVTEKYLVEAETVGDAETRIAQEVAPFVIGEYEVDSVRKKRISEIIRNEEGENWFSASVAFVTLDEKSGAEKRAISCIYLNADNFNVAYNGVCEKMKDTASDWELVCLSESPVVEVFFFDERKEEVG